MHFQKSESQGIKKERKKEKKGKGFFICIGTKLIKLPQKWTARRGQNLDILLLKVLRAHGHKKTIEEVLRVVTCIVDKNAEMKYKVCPVFDSTLVGKLIFRPRPKNEVSRI